MISQMVIQTLDSPFRKLHNFVLYHLVTLHYKTKLSLPTHIDMFNLYCSVIKKTTKTKGRKNENTYLIISLMVIQLVT